MRKIISLLLCLTLLCTSLFAVSAGLKDKEHRAMHVIVTVAPQYDSEGSLKAGLCTAYAIAPHVLLTAQHCDMQDGILYVDPPNREAIRSGKLLSVGITEKLYDKHDHMLLVVPGLTFKDTIKYDPSHYHLPYQGEHVYFWGTPGTIPNIYREGYVMGLFPMNNNDENNAAPDVPYVFALDMLVHGGDSGSSVFDEKTGELVGIVSYGMSEAETITGMYALAFTPDQVKEATHRKEAVPTPRPFPQPVVDVPYPTSFIWWI